MNRLLKLVASLSGLALTLAACSSPQSAEAQSLARSTEGFAPTIDGLMQATFAGGCFWAQEEAFEEIKGVKQVVSGYAGGTVERPTYEQVCGQKTGHAESINIYYDPKVVSFQTLLNIFFTASHDPTQLNRQGNDSGPEYRSVAFYRTMEEKKTIETTIARVNASKQWGDKIVTQVLPMRTFWPAEDYHQGYFRRHPNEPYIAHVSQAKVDHVRKLFKSELKNPL